jgi:hypothetical protein
MSGTWTCDEDWEADDAPAWLPAVPVNDNGEAVDEQDDPLDWEDSDDLDEILDE